MSDVDRTRDVEEMLASLPDSFRVALRLCYFEGLTHEEAATRLGCPVGTVRSRLARGRALLRRRLEDSPTSQLPGIATSDPEAGATSPALAPALVHLTSRAALQFAAGLPLAGVAPARVATVATGVLGTMSRAKFVAAASLVMTITSIAALAASAGRSGLADRAGPAASENRPVARGTVAPTAVAVAQAETGTRRKASDQVGQNGAKTPADLPADFPAFVVETRPMIGDVEVDAAATSEIRIVFSKPMTDKSWSLTQGNVYSFPESAGPMRYLADRRTCVVPVKLQPGKTYVMGINGGRFNNFKDAEGRPALPSSLAFRTRKAE